MPPGLERMDQNEYDGLGGPGPDGGWSGAFPGQATTDAPDAVMASWRFMVWARTRR
jgi:hypothetical protein